jgi:hypothetical protein
LDRGIRLLLAAVLGMAVSDAAADENPAHVTAAAFTSDGQQVVVGSQQGLQIIGWPTLQPVRELTTNLVHIHDVQFSPDGRSFVAAGGEPSEQGRLEHWNWPDGNRLLSADVHADVIYRITWSADQTSWTTAGGDGRCYVVDAKTGQPGVTFSGHSRAMLALQALGQETNISAGLDHTLQLWRSSNGHHVRTLNQHVGAVNDVAVRPGQNSNRRIEVASASEDRTVRIWQPEIGRLVRFARLPSIPRCLSWSPDGRWLFAGCDDGRIRQIDPNDTSAIVEVGGVDGRIHMLLVTSDGRQLFIAGSGPCRTMSISLRE